MGETSPAERAIICEAGTGQVDIVPFPLRTCAESELPRPDYFASLRLSRQRPSLFRSRSRRPPPGAGTVGTLVFLFAMLHHHLVARRLRSVRVFISNTLSRLTDKSTRSMRHAECADRKFTNRPLECPEQSEAARLWDSSIRARLEGIDRFLT